MMEPAGEMKKQHDFSHYIVAKNGGPQYIFFKISTCKEVHRLDTSFILGLDWWLSEVGESFSPKEALESLENTSF